MRWNLLSSAGRRLRNWWEEEGKPPNSSSFGASASPASRQNTSSPSTLTVLNVVMFTPRSDAVLTVPGRHRMPAACLLGRFLERVGDVPRAGTSWRHVSPTEGLSALASLKSTILTRYADRKRDRACRLPVTLALARTPT